LTIQQKKTPALDTVLQVDKRLKTAAKFCFCNFFPELRKKSRVKSKSTFLFFVLCTFYVVKIMTQFLTSCRSSEDGREKKVEWDQDKTDVAKILFFPLPNQQG
jgi:hypothetical protein